MGCIRKSVLIATAINCGRSAGSGGSSGFGGCAAVEFRENFHDSRRRPRVDGGGVAAIWAAASPGLYLHKLHLRSHDLRSRVRHAGGPGIRG